MSYEQSLVDKVVEELRLADGHAVWADAIARERQVRRSRRTAIAQSHFGRIARLLRPPVRGPATSASAAQPTV